MWFKWKRSSKERKQSRICPSSLTYIDLVELFDALIEYICDHEQCYVRLSELAIENFSANGRGIFVVEAALENESSRIVVETDLSRLCSSFMWWNHEKCEAEMPDYSNADSESTLCTSLFNYNPHTEFLVAMVWRQPPLWGTEMTSLCLCTSQQDSQTASDSIVESVACDQTQDSSILNECYDISDHICRKDQISSTYNCRKPSCRKSMKLRNFLGSAN